MQVCSTPNVHHASNDLHLPTRSAEAHFMEQEFYNEISLYSSLRHKHIANLIAVHTQQRSTDTDDENDDDCASSMLNGLDEEGYAIQSLNIYWQKNR